MRADHARELCWLGAVPETVDGVETAAWEHGLSLVVRDPREPDQIDAAVGAALVVVTPLDGAPDPLTLAAHLRSRRGADELPLVCGLGDRTVQGRLARALKIHVTADLDGDVEIWSRRLAKWLDLPLVAAGDDR